MAPVSNVAGALAVQPALVVYSLQGEEEGRVVVRIR